jgi:hypothetical protein
MEFIRELLLSSDINYIKFGILHLRKQLILEVNPPVLELVKNGFMNSLLNLLEKYINVDSIVVRRNFLNFFNLNLKYF